MKRVFGRIGLVALAAFAMLAVAAHADTFTAKRNSAFAPRYDANREVTLEGTVTNVVKTKGGILAGGHLVLVTSKGTVDGALGPFALRGAHAIPIAAGDNVKVVGVMTTIRNLKMFLVRTVENANHTYTVRNERGIPLLAGAPPQPPAVSVITGGQR
jgi:hypothetical protein